jgi:hypothetical protein
VENAWSVVAACRKIFGTREAMPTAAVVGEPEEERTGCEEEER